MYDSQDRFFVRPRALSSWFFTVLAVTATACVPLSSSLAASPIDTPQWRSALHYTPQRNWMNDPNGLVYYKGLYHLFYQYNPHGNFWGDMSWGHATSRDLIHWDEQAVAMRANPSEEVFSGSVVVDTRNTSGLGTVKTPPLVALYTSVYNAGSGHEPGVQAQSLAYSIDDGTTWQQYAHNPVLTLNPESSHFRDPKVSWYAPGGYWLMTAVVADAHVVKLYRSDNLVDWTFLSDFTLPDVPHRGALWEMPDLFALPLDGDPARRKWVMIVNVNPWSIAGGSGAMYFVGQFDGTHFVPDDVAPAGSDPARYQWLDHGADYYAAGTFSNAPAGKAVTIGWMNNWDYASHVPTSPWKGAMALPRELALKTIDGRPQLTSVPSSSYESLVKRLPPTRIEAFEVSSATRDLALSARGAVQNIELTIRPGTAQRAGMIVRASASGDTGTRIFYDVRSQTLTVDRSHSGNTWFSGAFSKAHVVDLPLHDGGLHLQVVIDRNSVEVFADHGRMAITDLIFPALDDDRVRVFAEGGDATFSDIAITSPR
ncbi:glycoside hydrolase family 32 protein [Paraburkholderia sp. CNPSo 3157]|uniref:Glycoside hydrolase family 32 protein n=1 Tax=Paraburkholderia franconis TaxID=2654983 RepID=A0A7X1NG42_9BURK|nr:glycoside hydrolase family 32 protein [Paraburkholderia franconis]MPW21317.1 glycoside hydrolase family 32 protein [Paraburkholderia franconis]